jgi:hypothetical protein
VATRLIDIKGTGVNLDRWRLRDLEIAAAINPPGDWAALAYSRSLAASAQASADACASASINGDVRSG